MIQLSQTQINLLETCPPQWQKMYLEQLAFPTTPEQEEKLAWGSRFHLLMQQHELGLSIEPFLEKDEILKKAFTALIANVPELSSPNKSITREAEHSRTLPLKNYLLKVIYDLLILDKKSAQIVDWKTYPQPENTTKLANNWQTRLYPYVLAETTDYLPEQITFTYWFVKIPAKPQNIKFKYNTQIHQKNHQDLTNLLNNLSQWLDEYFSKKTPFPHIPKCQEKCPYYQYLVTNPHQPNSPKSIAEIPEIPI